MIHQFLSWLEGSALGHAMRESGPWTYALVNLTHILGVSTLFGSVLILDLRLLGCWKRIPLASLSGAAVTLARIGFAVAAVAGLGLLATQATEYIGNPFMLIKFPAIAVALINVAALSRSTGWRAHTQRDLSMSEQRQLAVFGGISLTAWLTAVAAGLMVGYW